MKTIFRGAEIISPFELHNKDVLVDGGKITEIREHIPDIEGARVIDATGMYLTPGFIDLHVHGGGGCSAYTGTAEDVVTMANAHANYGTTTLLPTLYTMPWEDMIAGAERIVTAMNHPALKSTIAGVHFEGPFFAPSQAGAQRPGSLVTPSEVDLSLLDPYLSYIKMFGIAPELPGALELGKKLSDMGIVVSVAHSDAFYPDVEKAIENGYSDVTHIYSACSGVRRVNAFRVAGVIEAGLERDELYVQAIADGCHLPDALLRLIYRTKGADKMYLITDGLELSATDAEEGKIYTQPSGSEVVCEDGVMKLLSREAFAGSIATTDRLLRTSYRAGIPLCDCVRMLTDTPARRIGLSSKGRIAPGYDADIVLLDKNLQVIAVMAGGWIIREMEI
ncbi:MAG: amidohydrolase family protein [Oscillospiraceae bacterium]|nr:amidohydrolase family protein [Oscillospiraceae bacterium]